MNQIMITGHNYLLHILTLRNNLIVIHCIVIYIFISTNHNYRNDQTKQWQIRQTIRNAFIYQ